MTTYWENALATSGSLEDRLQAMSPEQVISFAAGCAEHALRQFVSTFDTAKVPDESVSPFTVRCREGLERCWAAVDGNSNAQAVESAILQLDSLFADDDLLEKAVNAGAHNIDQLTASAYKALECVKHSGHPGYAIGAANCAYNSVLQWYVSGEGETVDWTDEESKRQQDRSEECQAELRFQTNYLASLETVGGDAAGYDNVVSNIP